MVATYSVDIAAMEGAQSSLRAIYTNLRAALDRLDGSRAQFESANVGLTVEGYSAAQAQWNAAMTEFQAAVESAGAAVGRIGENYQHVDARGRTLFQA